MLLLVRVSLRFGNLLYPMRDLSLKILVSSSVFWIMFQFDLIKDPMWGFFGLNWVTITGTSLVWRGTVSRSSPWVNFLALR